jgi:NTE family protein
MAEDTVDILLLGGGRASVMAAETLREEGCDGTIAILSAEAVLPYIRTPLSKGYLRGEVAADTFLIRPESFYQQKRIDLRRGQRAVAVVPQDHLVRTDSGETIRYRKLLIATGCRPRGLNVHGATLGGIFRLHSRADADAIHAAAVGAKRALVVGGSFLGLEVASSLTRMGLAVTLVEPGAALMPELHAPRLSEAFAKYAGDAGVEIVTGDGISRFEGAAAVEHGVTLSGRRIACDLVVVAIGVAPEADFLEGSGIVIDNGVYVDAYLATAVPDVYAAGDVANFWDPVFNRRRRIEHWVNADRQGRLAARNMLGQGLPYDEISSFFGEVFDLKYTVFGSPEDGEEFVERGTFGARTYSLFYLRNNIPCAVFTLGDPALLRRGVDNLMRYRVNVSARRAHLADPSFALDRLPRQNVLILQGGGALGAFECGVVKALEEAGLRADIVAGVSIGALNGSIVASHPNDAAEALADFWRELTVQTPDLYNPDFNRAASALQILTTGVPNFFRPRWHFDPMKFMRFDPLRFAMMDPRELEGHWTSFYDTSPMRRLIAKYVDFPKLKSSPVRLLVSAVNVETAELETFDSYIDDLTADHVLASGSLPPGFPWTTINGNHYWDGGIISNSPLDLVLDRCGPSDKRVFIVDLFAERTKLPANFLQVIARRDEITFAERIRNDVRTRALIDNFRDLVDEIVSGLGDDAARAIKELPRFVQLMGPALPNTIVRVTRQGQPGEPSSRDYDFSQHAVQLNMTEGYRLAHEAIAKARGAARAGGDTLLPH